MEQPFLSRVPAPLGLLLAGLVLVDWTGAPQLLL
jgi:hypothetical protein